MIICGSPSRLMDDDEDERPFARKLGEGEET